MDDATTDDRRLTRMRRRFARRQWARRWRVWRWAVSLLVVIVLVVGGLWAVYGSSWLAVQGVTVSGASQSDRASIEKAAAVPIGQPLARVDLDAVRRRVEAIETVASADVTRSWPDRIAISIVEREAVAVVQGQSQFRALDREGEVFGRYNRRPRGLPVVRTDLAVDARTLSEAAAVVTALPDQIASMVDYVTVQTVDDIRLALRDGRVVIWGSAAESETKAEVLLALLPQRGRTYDVSVPGQPTVSDAQRP